MAQHIHRREGTRALQTALIITIVFMLAEFAGGLWTNSLALMADAGHMLTDAAALGLSLFAVWFIRKPATPEKTYGYFRVEILAALVNGATLAVISVFILYESYHRFAQPQHVRSLDMLVIASVGLVANLASAWILSGGHEESLNVRGAFLHVVGDAIGSVGAIVASVSMLLWQAYWTDPLVSVLVSVLILMSAWKLVRDSVSILLEGTPSHVNMTAMREEFCEVPGVESIHDLHVWTLTSGVHAMTCHAVVDGNGDEILERLSEISRDHFHIDHITIQIEEQNLCRHEKKFCAF